MDLTCPISVVSTSFRYSRKDPVRSDTDTPSSVLARMLAPLDVSLRFRSQP